MTHVACAQAVWAELLVDALVASGVGTAVLSPGSRSTPLVLALVSNPAIRIVDVIDERSAGFVALGMGRATGSPAVLVCTSGSAPTHYYPAVVEADASGVPLLVLSANRPFSLQRAGESQTIDQTKLYGDRVRFFADLGEPSARASDLRAMRRVVAQATYRARCGGPVHLDARFVKPLEPNGADTVDDSRHRALAQSMVSDGVPVFFDPRRCASEEGVAALASRLRNATRPMVVVGPRSSSAPSFVEALSSLNSRTEIPVFVDAASNARFSARSHAFFGGLDAIYRSAEARRALAPDFVLQVGRSSVATGFAKLMTDRVIDLGLVDETDFLDPHSRATLVVHGDVGDVLVRVGDALAAESGKRSYDAAWLARIMRAEAVARAGAESLCDAPDAGLSEAGVARALIGSVPEHGRVLLGNSLAIRNVDGWVSPSSRPVVIDSQRGVSGIDGLVAGLVGASLATAAPTALLLGDVSLAHDIGSLALLRLVDAPTLVVVVDNGGGRIFEQLPVAGSVPGAMSHFTTPPGLDLSRLATAMGIDTHICDSTARLCGEIRRAMSHGARATVLVCRVPSHGAARMNEALWAEVNASIERELAS